MDPTRVYDVLVVGGGNAALCAAIEARRAGASVLVVEKASKFYRGGNTRHTRNLRPAHAAADETLEGPYPIEEFWEDLLRVTGGQTDEALAKHMLTQSEALLPWLKAQGVRFQPSLGGSLSLGRTNAFFLGGGRAMLNSLYRTAARLSVDVAYETPVRELNIDAGAFRQAVVEHAGARIAVRAKALVAASGGFESNIDWLKQYWGERAENFLIRGTANNTGEMLRTLLDQGVESAGDPTQWHGVAIDARAPRYDGGIITRLDCIPFGIVVDESCERFYDEGEDLWPKRYAIWGRLLADRPNQKAFVIFDSRTIALFMPSLYPPVSAPDLQALAGKLGLDPAKFQATIGRFNEAVQPGAFDPDRLDDCRTQGLQPPKSHWARRIEAAPFYAYPLRPGVTFTYMGVRVDARSRMRMTDGRAAANMFAAGEIMAGSVLGKGYLAGIGMTIGGVFGRIAGQEAARHALG